MIVTFIYGLSLLFMAAIITFAFFVKVKFRTLGLSASFVAYGFTLLLAVFTLLGKPVPQNVITDYLHPDGGEFEVLWYTYAEGKYIYVLLQNGVNAPLYMTMPWDPKKAQAMDDGKQKQKMFLMQRNGNMSRTFIKDPYGKAEVGNETFEAQQILKPN